MINKFFKSTLIFLIFFLLLEFILFFYEKYHPTAFDSEYSIPCVEKVEHPVFYTYKINCKKKFAFPYSKTEKYIINFETNSCYMRDEEKYCKKINNNKNKFFFFGDSSSQNQYLKNDHNYPKIFEKKINANNIRYDVLNFGIPGYSLRQNFENIKKITKDIDIEGDHVVLQFLLNDIMDIIDHPPHKIKKYLKTSYTFRLLNKIRRGILYPKNYASLNQLLFDEYNNVEKYKNLEKNLCKVKDYILSKKANPTFLFLPYMDSSTSWENYEIESIEKKILISLKNCEWENIIYVVPDLKKINFADAVIQVNINHHLNASSNTIISEKLFEHFKRKDLF